MNILIGFLRKISNSNLKLYIVHLWATSVAVARMSSDDASRLKILCSRPCLGLVSVMCRSWFCVDWVMSRGVTVMSRFCFRSALLMSRGWHDDVSVTSRCCFGGVLVMSRSCFRNALLMSRSCLGFVTVASQRCFGDVSVMSRCCFGIVGAVLNVSGRPQLCGLVSGMSP